MRIRNRLINFRVTDEEFHRLKEASSLRKARCLSEFARSVMLATTDLPGARSEPDDPVHSRLQSFDQRLSTLESAFARILEAVEKPEPVS